MLRVLFKFVPTDVQNERKRICATCEYRKEALIDYCSMCGCAIQAKTKLRLTKCPVGKW
jgi:hypothetical protein